MTRQKSPVFLLFVSLMLALLRVEAQTWQQVALRTDQELTAGIGGGEGMQLVTAMAYAPSNPSIVYAGMDTMQVYKSIDGGTTWQRCGSTGLPVNGVSSLVVSPTDPNVVLVTGDVMTGTTDGSDGIYRTQDGGSTWTKVYSTTFPRGNDTGGELFAFNGSTVYAGTQSAGLLKSTDGGVTWAVLNNSTGLINDVKRHPMVANIIYLATTTGVKRVVDNGATSTITTVNALVATAIGFNQSSPNIVYAATAGGFSRSTDGGTNFTSSITGLPAGVSCEWLSVSPVNGNYLFLSIGGAWPLLPYHSVDGGVNWVAPVNYDAAGLQTNLYLPTAPLRAFHGTPIPMHPTTLNTALLSTDCGIFKTTDGGTNWTYSGSGNCGGRSVNFGWYPADTNRMVFFLTDFGVMMTTNAGSTFRYVKSPSASGFSSVGAVDPTAASGVIVAAVGNWTTKRVARTTDFGANWTLPSGPPFANYTFVAFNPQNANIVYMNNYKSTDKGATWAVVPSSKNIQAIFPGDGNVVYSPAGSTSVTISKSTDAGATWPTSYPAVTVGTYRNMCVDPTNQNRLYVAGDNGLYIYDGTSWSVKNQANGLALDAFGSVSACVVAVDPTHPNVVYVGKWRSFQGHSNGIFRSEDFGNSFTNITGNLGPNFTVEGMSVNPTNGYVYIGSSFGTWKLPPPYGASLPVVTISATDASAAEPSDTGTFTVSRTGSTSAALTVNYTVGGTATSGSDYTALSGSVTIGIGASSAPITVTPINDATIESTETVIATLSANASYTVGSPSSATVNIADDDTLPVVTITATDASAAEPSDTGTFTVSRTGSTSAALTVNYTVGGTATSGSDYTALSGSVTIGIGASSAPITVTPVNDSTAESAETVIATISANASYTVGSPSSATITITDDDGGSMLGMVAWYKFDELSGTTAADSSGSNNVATLYNGATWTTGTNGNAASVDGVNDFVFAPSSASFNSMSTQMTVATWVFKRANIPSGTGSIIGRRIGPTFYDLWILYYGNDTYNFALATTLATNNVAGTTSTGDLNTWVHMAGVFDGTTAKLYRNGVLMASTATAGTIPSQTSGVIMGAGDNGTTTNEFTNAKLDDVRIYNRALSATEVLALYNGGAQHLLVTNPDLFTINRNDSGFLFSFSGKPFGSYAVERADDISFHSNVSTFLVTNLPANGTMEFEDNDPQVPTSFYRVKQLQ